MRYNDPTGHWICDPDANTCNTATSTELQTNGLVQGIGAYGWSIEGPFSIRDLKEIMRGVKDNATRLARSKNSVEKELSSPSEISREIFGGQTFSFSPNTSGVSINEDGKITEYYCERSGKPIGVTCHSNSQNRADFTNYAVVHEIAHVFNNIVGSFNLGGISPYSSFAPLVTDLSREAVGKRGIFAQAESTGESTGEFFADAYLNYVYGSINLDDPTG